MKNLPLKELESAIADRNPLLAERLQPAISETKARKALERAGATGAIEPLLQLYSWKNGTIIDRELASSKTGFFPGPAYQFTELGRAIGDFKTLQEAFETRSDGKKLAEGVGRYFPFLWSGAVKWISVDLHPSWRNRVMLIDTDGASPYVEAYTSFEDFISDVIRANYENVGLQCFSAF